MTGRHLPMYCVLLGLAIALAGCVYSVESVIAESGVTFDPRLLGGWEEVGGSDRAVVTRSARNGYAIQYSSNDSVHRYGARLGQLGDRLILDVSVPREDGSAKAPGDHPLAWHLVFVLDVADDEIRAALIDADSLAAAIRAGRVRLDAHARSASCPQRCVPNAVILHGTTEELRATLPPYLARAGALAPPTVFRRVPAVRKAALAPPTHADSSTILTTRVPAS